MKSQEIHSVSDAECLEKENRESGNEFGRAFALVSPTTTLNRDAVPIGVMTSSQWKNLVWMSKQDAKKKKNPQIV